MYYIGHLIVVFFLFSHLRSIFMYPPIFKKILLQLTHGEKSVFLNMNHENAYK